VRRWIHYKGLVSIKKPLGLSKKSSAEEPLLLEDRSKTKF
jgi:hypothetical protein